ncbi:MAG: hypothetical protein ACOYXB_17065 [Bacteroidota bacterium]
MNEDEILYKLATFLFLMQGYEWFDVDYDTYTIDNASDYQVLITTYLTLSNGIIIAADSIALESKQQYRVEKVTGEDNDPPGYFSSVPDSVVITFNSGKRMIFTCSTPYDLATGAQSCQEPGNPLFEWNTSYAYDNIRKGYDFTYVITNQDYADASPMK